MELLFSRVSDTKRSNKIKVCPKDLKVTSLRETKVCRTKSLSKRDKYQFCQNKTSLKGFIMGVGKNSPHVEEILSKI